MIFYISNIKDKDKYTFSINHEYLKENIEIEESLDTEDFFAIKVFREVNENLKGVLSSSNTEELNSYVKSRGGDKIVQLGYIFFDKKLFSFYYSVPKSTFESVLNAVFGVLRNNITYEADLSELHTISSIKLVKTPSDRDLFSVDTDIDRELSKDIYQVMEDNQKVYREEYTVEYKYGAFKPTSLNRLIEEVKGDSMLKLHILGEDKNRNPISISEKIIKKINVDTLNSFDIINSKTFDEIIKEIKSRII